MSKQNKSLLLPGTFFEKDIQRKLDYLNLKDVNTVYVFDHLINPVDSKLPMYEIRNAIKLLQNYEERKFKIGSAVLNINKRKIDNLIKEYINPFLEIDGFKLGLGLGDDTFEQNLPNYSNNLEEVVSYIVENFKLAKEDKSIFLGGQSNLIIQTMKKYSLGINQWLGSIESLYKKRDLFNKIDKPLGSISLCLDKKLIAAKDINFKDIELIYIIKESNLDKFYSQVDNFLL
tara:strand:- start:178 stop:870 length:693 start_codon:yes stop_codon:yes gene_type:complete